MLGIDADGLDGRRDLLVTVDDAVEQLGHYGAVLGVDTDRCNSGDRGRSFGRDRKRGCNGRIVVAATAAWRTPGWNLISARASLLTLFKRALCGLGADGKAATFPGPIYPNAPLTRQTDALSPIRRRGAISAGRPLSRAEVAEGPREPVVWVTL